MVIVVECSETILYSNLKGSTYELEAGMESDWARLEQAWKSGWEAD